MHRNRSTEMRWRFGVLASGLGLLLLPLQVAAATPKAKSAPPPVYPHWEEYHVADGLPSEKILAVGIDGPRVWVGTDHGVALLEDGRFRVFTTADGLAHDAILSLAVDHQTGDVWFGTAGGLSRYSAGKWETFTQFNSGLPNNVIFGVAVEEQNPWVATTAGTGRYRVRDRGWDVYTPLNSPQHEPWGYFVDYGGGKVWAALWGGGLLEFDPQHMTWKSYLDPDGEMEIDLFRDDGIIHVITTGTSWGEGLAWVSTYFGLSRYDGHRWRSYMEKDSGLASDFINFVKANGRTAWICTDKGLSAVHADSEQVVSYVPIHGPMEGARGWEARIYEAGKLIRRVPLARGLANNFLWGVGFDDQGDAWVATSWGLSHGSVRPLPPRPPATTKSAQLSPDPSSSHAVGQTVTPPTPLTSPTATGAQR